MGSRCAGIRYWSADGVTLLSMSLDPALSSLELIAASRSARLVAMPGTGNRRHPSPDCCAIVRSWVVDPGGRLRVILKSARWPARADSLFRSRLRDRSRTDLSNSACRDLAPGPSRAGGALADWRTDPRLARPRRDGTVRIGNPRGLRQHLPRPTRPRRRACCGAVEEPATCGSRACHLAER